MSDLFHIIITGDKRKARSFFFSKRRLQLTCVITASLFIALSILGNNALHFFFPNTNLNNQVTQLNSQLQKSNALKKELTLQIQKLQQLNREQTEAFQKEKTTLLNTAVTELEERSGMIERIMCNLGVDIKNAPKTNKNSGGPFIAPQKDRNNAILFRSDHYMEAISFLPLGRPVPGLVTSRFGHRTDPVNGKKGFHTGVDLRGRNGQQIVATADGVVTRSFFNGSYGRYIEICHGNGYTTKYAHMQKLLVKHGDKVKRGQLIGTVGSSGRSTGPHLHYEICLHNKPINPSTFMRVDKLTRAPVIQQSKIKIKHLLVTENKNLSSSILTN